MITLNEAIKRIDGAVLPLEGVKTPISKAVGCRLIETVKSPINVPDFDCSIMDGIAFCYDDLSGETAWKIPLQTTIAAGEQTIPKLKSGHAVKIMTGAPLPPGADTVQKIEDVEIDDGEVIISDKGTKGMFVRPKGDDIKIDELLFEAGTVLTAVDCGVLASIGLIEVEVTPYPKIAVLSTGTEIVEPGQKRRFGQRYDSNKTTLMTLLQASGYPVEQIDTILPDKINALKETLESCLNKYNLLITSGGVSMGDFDYIPKVILEIGGTILFHKVKVKPGKPVLIAKLGRSWLVALPGNPVGVVAGYHLHVKRIIKSLMNIPNRPKSGLATLEGEINLRGSRFGMIGAFLESNGNGSVVARPVPRQDSGRLSSVKGINGFIMLDESERTIRTGDAVTVEWLY
jgi:molybdopterin molybdotransferase